MSLNRISDIDIVIGTSTDVHMHGKPANDRFKFV